MKKNKLFLLALTICVSQFNFKALAQLNFTTASKVSVSSQPFSVAKADFNADGKTDLVTANSGNGTVSVLLGNGNGTFAAAASSTVGTQPECVAVADFNNDGKPDIITADFIAHTVS